MDIDMPWGIIARFTDMDGLVQWFAANGMALVEFHLSDRDLDFGLEGFRPTQYPFDLVVHAPEYYYDYLIDLCSADTARRRASISRIQKTIDLSRQLTRWFSRISPRGPKVVIHVGGMLPQAGDYDVTAASDRLLDSIRQLNMVEVDLLLENLPPFPWYFGGRWFGYVLTDAANTVKMCAESGLGLCFDTSHAALECNRSHQSLIEFARSVIQYIRHIHISDGAGVSGEGLQIGEGQINFVELMPLLTQANSGCVPEIWMGHHQDGDGFQKALERLTEIVWANRVLARATKPVVQVELQRLIVPLEAKVSAALQIINANTLGIAFVVDEQGVVRGVVTDGDIRRGLLQDKNLKTPVTDVMTRDFVFALDDMSMSDVRARLSTRYRVIPILDSAHRLVNFASIYQASSNQEVVHE